MKSLEIAFVDEDPFVRDSLSIYLNSQEDFEVVAGFESAEAILVAIEKLSFHRPDILLINVGLPGMNGIDALPLILHHFADLDIVILTKYEEEETIVQALKNGASAYVSKKSGLADVAEAIRIVNQGGSYMSPTIARQIANYFQNYTPLSKAEHHTLSSRQDEILYLLVEGKTYQELADMLFISVETVRSHIKKMYKILHVHNKAEAITKYMRGEID